MLSQPNRLEIEVPLIFCRSCKNQPMIIKSVRPHLLKRETKVEFVCPKCRAEVKDSLR